MNIKDRVIKLLVEICATKKVGKDLDMDLIDSGYLDSMGVVELLTELEDEFGVEIPLDSFDKQDFNTANKIINYVNQNMEE